MVFVNELCKLLPNEQRNCANSLRQYWTRPVCRIKTETTEDSNPSWRGLFCYIFATNLFLLFIHEVSIVVFNWPSMLEDKVTIKQKLRSRMLFYWRISIVCDRAKISSLWYITCMNEKRNFYILLREPEIHFRLCVEVIKVRRNVIKPMNCFCEN